MKAKFRDLRKLPGVTLNILVQRLGRQSDDSEIELIDILNLEGWRAALYALEAVEGHEKEMRAYAIRIASLWTQSMRDPRAVAAFLAANKFVEGGVSEAELAEAHMAAMDAELAELYHDDYRYECHRAARAAFDVSIAEAHFAARNVTMSLGESEIPSILTNLRAMLRS